MASIDDTIAGAVEECLQLLKMGGVVDPDEGLHTATTGKRKQKQIYPRQMVLVSTTMFMPGDFRTPPLSPLREYKTKREKEMR